VDTPGEEGFLIPDPKQIVIVGVPAESGPELRTSKTRAREAGYATAGPTTDAEGFCESFISSRRRAPACQARPSGSAIAESSGKSHRQDGAR
jgi:hypothetical protein